MCTLTPLGVTKLFVLHTRLHATVYINPGYLFLKILHKIITRDCLWELEVLISSPKTTFQGFSVLINHRLYTLISSTTYCENYHMLH